MRLSGSVGAGMPLVRIELPSGLAGQGRAVADVVHDALVATMGVPVDDRFQIVTEHGDGLIVSPEYLGLRHGPNALVIQITLNAGRSTAQKKALYRAVAD